MCVATRDIMDVMFDVYLEGTIEPDDIPQTHDPVFILGKQYNSIQQLSEIRQDITSKLWFTYRKNFVPIGGVDGLTSDKGWGCMLRCGQMVLAQALISLHLHRDWHWHRDTKDSTYLKILNKFEDKRQAPFSIHQIAMMGVSENKDVGQWFGPNTVAQVLKKLVKYDEWSQIEVHIALDNTLIINDVKQLCVSGGGASQSTGADPAWKPLLLVVPLRLGLHEINPIYISGLRKCFQFRQSLGVIGGKPNLALYFIGCVGEEVIYLDPHTTQKACTVDNKASKEEIENDSSYHCAYASRMNILAMDPSVALCFFCKNQADFDELCKTIKESLIDAEKQPLFEITHEKPKQWIPVVDDAAEAAEFDGQGFDSEHEFEIL